MKKLLLITVCFLFSWLVLIISCKKEKVPPAEPNSAPSARAGNDTTMTFISCEFNSGTVTLDGTGSTDPDNNINHYNWSKLSGPDGIIIQDVTAAKTTVEKISVGTYVLILSVVDQLGLISRDTVMVEANGEADEYDLDISTVLAHEFSDNSKDCYYGCVYTDITSIIGHGTTDSLGQVAIYISEYSDTAALSDVHSTYMTLQVGGNGKYINGTISTNFKKLFVQGGGAFTGTLTVGSGSAHACGVDFQSLQPLEISGSLDSALHTLSITIKGKILL